MNCNNQPLLSICIPTYNRPVELSEALRILDEEIRKLDPNERDRIEVIVSDNHSPEDKVSKVVQPYLDYPARVKFFLQPENIGPTLNFEYCYKRSSGKYVFLLSDDDHLISGALQIIYRCLEESDPDIVFLPLIPQQKSSDTVQLFERDEFLLNLGFLPTLVSSCILKKTLIEPVLGRYLDTNLHHFFYFLTALENGEKFFCVNRQILYCPYQDNSGGYNWFRTFGAELPRIVREFPIRRIGPVALSAVGRHLLKSHIIPTFINRKINGYILNKRFSDDSTWAIVKIIARNFYMQPAFWIMFVPLTLIPVPILKKMKQLYRWQKSFLFQWHPS